MTHFDAFLELRRRRCSGSANSYGRGNASQRSDKSLRGRAHEQQEARAGRVMGWRDHYKVHPAADVFPMMSDAELVDLGEDIKKNGIKVPIGFWHPRGEPKLSQLIDGRNRLEAAQRVGFDIENIPVAYVNCSDPASWVISLNIRRRHLTKQQRADLIVAAISAGEKLVQAEPVSKGGRGKKSKLKEKAVAAGAENGISESTVKRAIAKADLTPEEIEARAEHFREQQRKRDEQAREQKAKRESDIAEALGILDALHPAVASRLVTLLMDDAVIYDVGFALHDKEMAHYDEENERREAELDEVNDGA